MKIGTTKQLPHGYIGTLKNDGYIGTLKNVDRKPVVEIRDADGLLRAVASNFDSAQQWAETGHDPDVLILEGDYPWIQGWFEEQLVGTAEVAKMLGWSKGKVATYRARGILPPPAKELAAGPLWWRHHIEEFRLHYSKPKQS